MSKVFQKFKNDNKRRQKNWILSLLTFTFIIFLLVGFFWFKHYLNHPPSIEEQALELGIDKSLLPNLESQSRKGVVRALSFVYDTGRGNFFDIVVVFKKSSSTRDKEGIGKLILPTILSEKTWKEWFHALLFFRDVLKEKGFPWNIDETYVLIDQINERVGSITGASATSALFLALKTAYFDEFVPKSLSITGHVINQRGVENFIFIDWEKMSSVENCKECKRKIDDERKYYFLYDYELNARKEEIKIFYFCSKKCAEKNASKRVFCIGKLQEKLTTVVEKGDCRIVVFPKDNHECYSIINKVKKVIEVESIEDLFSIQF